MSLVKKYLNLNNQKIFVGQLLGDYLEEMSDYIKNVLEDSEIFYTLIFNTRLVDDIIYAYTDITNTLDRLVEKYRSDDFEQKRDWRKMMFNDLSYLFNTLEAIEQRFNPSDRKLSNSDIYFQLTKIFSSILDDLSTIMQRYLKIQDYQEADQSKFYPESQISISVLQDRPWKNIMVISRRSGFCDKDGNVLKKQIVSIHPVEDAQNNNI